MPEYLILAKNVRRIRTQMKMSQLKFAMECDISLDILSMIEREQTNPRLSTLQKIAAYTGKTVAELLTPPEETKSKQIIYSVVSLQFMHYNNLVVK